MPQYLGLDFLTQAIHDRRSQLESMRIPPPHHIEIVDIYIHKGQTSDTSYSAPWKDCDTVSVSDGMFSCSPVSIQEELSHLSKLYTQYSLEDWSSNNTTISDDDEVSSDTDLLALSQDIDLAMREFGPHRLEGHSNKEMVGDEDFKIENVSNWDLMVDQDSMGDHLLELPESPNRVDTLLSVIPNVDDLSRRLKPKLIQDPFINENGRPYSTYSIFRADSVLVLSEAGNKDSQSESESIKDFTEEFIHEPLLAEHETDIDPLFEINFGNGMENEGPLSLLTDYSEVELPVTNASPDKSLQDADLLKEESTKELEMLVKETAKVSPSAKQSQDKDPEFSPTTDKTVGQMDFPQLNNQDVSSDSDDSGIGHALLESPILVQPHPPLSPTLDKQLALLEPLPMSPDKNIVLLSPGAERKLKKELWRGERVFDTILAHTLPYPDTGEGIDAALSVCVVSGLISLLEIKDLKMDGDSELDLPWDPLADSHHEMDLAQESLITRQPTFDPLKSTLDKTVDSVKDGDDLGREIFSKADYVSDVNNHDEAIDLPLSMSPIEHITRDRCDVDTDIPMLGLKQTLQSTAYPVEPPSTTSILLPSSTSSNALPHRKDMAWNLLLQSTSGHSNKHVLQPGSLRTDLSSKDQTATNTNIAMPTKSAYSCSKPASGSRLQEFEMFSEKDDGVSCLDTFLLLRSNLGSTRGEVTGRVRGGLKRGISEVASYGDGEPLRKKSVECIGNDTLMELDLIERVATPTYLDVCLSGEYLATISKLEQFAVELCAQLQDRGFRSRERNVREISVDSIKFFLKQQQKALEDNQSSSKMEVIMVSCQLAASLYLTCSVMDALFNYSLGAGLGRFVSLCEKYQELLGEKVVPVKKELLSLQLASREVSGGHPKLHELVRVVSTWRNKERTSRKEKAVVVVDTEFPSISGEILDYLQSIPGLKCCVFSFLPDSSSLDNLYLKAIEERFKVYDCLVVSLSSLTSHDSFPWEIVSLLVEYEQLVKPLFGCESTLEKRQTGCEEKGSIGVTVADRLHLRKYISLRTVQDISRAMSSQQYGDLNDLTSAQYTLIASERITANTQLLQLLETRHSIQIIERDYQTYYKRHGSKCFAYPDLIIDDSTGLLLRPLSILATDQGVRALINTVTALSFQFERCWVLLYTQDQSRYPYGGDIPSNLTRLHASIAHYCPKLDEYTVKVITMSGMEQVSQWVRRIAEETHKNRKVCNKEKWINSSWIDAEMTEGERILLSFPCLNSFSALRMLREVSLGGLLGIPLAQLNSCFPWLSHKVTKMFHGICHSSAMPDIGGAQSSSLPSLAAACDSDMTLETEPTFDDCGYSHGLQYTPIESPINRYNSLALDNPVSIPRSSLQGNSSLQADISSNFHSGSNDSITRSICGSNSSQVDIRSNFPSHISINDSLEEVSDESGFQRDDCFDDVVCLNDYSEGLIGDYSYSRQGHQETIDLTSPLKHSNHDLDIPNHLLFSCDVHDQPGFRVNCSTEPEPPRIFKQQTSNTVCSFGEQDSFSHTKPVSHVGQDMNMLGLFAHKQDSLKNGRSITDMSAFVVKPSEVEGSSSAMRLLSSSRRIGKSPTQKQIKESVIDKIFHNNSSSNLTSSASIRPALSRFISSSAVKGRTAYSNSSSQVRTPVKSLDIGFRAQSNHKVYLQCNDRVISRLENSDILRNPSAQSRNDSCRSKPLTSEIFGRDWSKLHVSRDSVVPSRRFFSPPSKDSSLYDSPGRNHKKQLTYQVDPNRTDGQTKLVLF